MRFLRYLPAIGLVFGPGIWIASFWLGLQPFYVTPGGGWYVVGPLQLPTSSVWIGLILGTVLIVIGILDATWRYRTPPVP
jgi:hypothetical protein